METAGGKDADGHRPATQSVRVQKPWAQTHTGVKVLRHSRII